MLEKVLVVDDPRDLMLATKLTASLHPSGEAARRNGEDGRRTEPEALRTVRLIVFVIVHELAI